MASEDAYSDSIWPVYTSEDFDAIDKICETQELQEAGQPSGSSGRPQIEIEVELPADVPFSKADDVKEGSSKNKKSLYDMFRRYGGFLSVTDCTGPSW